MKSKLALLLGILMSASLLAACASTSDVAETTATTITATTTAATEAPTTTATQAPTTTAAQAPTTALETTLVATEIPHEHKYTEVITTEVTCDADGLKTFTCECGDTYTESITATGHIFENYISNNDATYSADGTETATCSKCDVTDTRTAEGSMLAYTYTDMDATMYAQKTVNARSMPSTDGEKLGSLSTNDEVKVTGQCAETNWYRIEYNGGVAYVSDSYLGNDKVVVQTEAPTQTQSEMPTYTTYADVKAYAISLGYPIGSATDNGDGTCTVYAINYITPNNTLSFDGEYVTMDADRTAARYQAEAILGFNPDIHNVDFGNYRNVTIANGENGYTWQVCREQFWIVAK